MVVFGRKRNLGMKRLILSCAAILSLTCFSSNDAQALKPDYRFHEFMALFQSGDPEADHNGDGQVTPADYNAFIYNLNKEMKRVQYYRAPRIGLRAFNGNRADPEERGRSPTWIQGFNGDPEGIAHALKLITFNVEELYPLGTRAFILRLPGGSIGHMGINQYLSIPEPFRSEIGRTFRAPKRIFPVLMGACISSKAGLLKNHQPTRKISAHLRITWPDKWTSFINPTLHIAFVCWDKFQPVSLRGNRKM